MPREELNKHYKERSAQYEALIKKENHKMSLLSLARLLALVAVLWFIVLAIRDQHAWHYIGAVLMLVAFLVLIKRFLHHKEWREVYKQLLKLNQQETQCQHHRFKGFEGGEEFSDPSHAWSHDLDLFGRGSLFQYMNRCRTRGGREQLAAFLSSGSAGPEELSERQTMVEELKEREEFRQMSTARGAFLEEEENDQEDFRRWLDRVPYISKHPWLFYLALGISALSILLIVLSIIVPGAYPYLLLLLFVNFSLLSPFLLRTNHYQESISRKHRLLQGYAGLLKVISATDFTHSHLLDNKQKATLGRKQVRRLSRLLNAFDWRLNMVLGVVLNGLFLFDFTMLYLLERWKKKNKEGILDWIGLCRWTDAMNSLGGFAFNHPDYVRPHLTVEWSSLDVQDLGHPLIPPDRRVNNSLTLAEEKVVLVTGANMAGKSTFLRALGVNKVLADTGCPVCASHFSMPSARLFTSMRTADSLADDESYFLAEIKRLQRGVQQMEKGEPLLILLDEVLKGTNTTDKRLGSEGLIRRALPYPVHCFIATHDLGLGSMEKEHPSRVVNYCFESYIENLELRFDYTIRKGLATNMNASFLMRQMGIME